ncbi:MAG: response regulator [Gemmatimonadetes bacterium]|nr:response regulator [Gemmatimonadota bacterium]
MPLLTNQSRRYALLGALFGCCFPIGATLMDVYVIHDWSLTWAVILHAQKIQPLHWIINTAPVVLGFFSAIAGQQQDRLIAASVEAETERRRASELAKFPDENPNPVLRLSRSGEILYANRAGQEFLDTIRDNGTLPLAWKSVLEEVLRGLTSRELELAWGDRTLSLIFTPVAENNYVNAYGRDVTERKRAESELHLAKEAAEAASRAKSDFLAHMSHELRTPMNAILGYTQILSSADDLPAPRRKLVETVGQAGEHLLSLINDVLDISKIEAGHAELNSTDFYLRRVIEGLSSMFELRCRQKSLAWKVERDFPDEPVHGDEGKLRQVLINLLGNAVKFTESGAVTLNVRLREDGCYEFSVIDTGAGIDPEKHEEIFTPFQQDREGVRQGGTGLGLAIARRHVLLMDGDLTLNSTPGDGSRFSFSIPLATGHHPGKATRAQGNWHRVRRLSRGHRVSALVVDDVLTNRDLLHHILTDIAAHVGTVGSGEAALEHVREQRPDIVFMDIRMPGIDGVETMRRLFNEHGEDSMKIVAVTASVLEHQRQEHEAAGFDGFLGKPLRAEQIYACLAEHLDVEFDYLERVGEDGDLRAEPTAADWSDLKLPAQLASNMIDAARNHSATDVRRQIDEIAELGPKGEALAGKLRELIARFDMNAIRDLVEGIPTE